MNLEFLVNAFSSQALLYSVLILPTVQFLKQLGFIQSLKARYGDKIITLLSLVVGSAYGAAGAAGGLLDSTLLQGVIFGVGAAMVNSGVYSLIFENKNKTPQLQNSSSFIPASVIDPWISKVGEYVLGLIKQLVPAPMVSLAQSVLTPLVELFVGSVLTDENKKLIRIIAQQKLREAGLLKSTNIAGKTAAASLLILLLAGCNLVQTTSTNILNSFYADGASLKYVMEDNQCYALIDTGETESILSTAFVEGVTPTDPRDNCTALGEAGYYCNLGTVDELYKLEYETCSTEGSITFEGQRPDGRTIRVFPN